MRAHVDVGEGRTFYEYRTDETARRRAKVEISQVMQYRFIVESSNIFLRKIF